MSDAGERISVKTTQRELAKSVPIVRPVLQELAKQLDFSIFNGTGTLKNTPQLGDHVIKVAQIKARVWCFQRQATAVSLLPLIDYLRDQLLA